MVCHNVASCNMEIIGRLHWSEKQVVVIYLRAVAPVMALSYCTAVHKWLNIDDPFAVCVCMRLFCLLSNSSFVHFRAPCKEMIVSRASEMLLYIVIQKNQSHCEVCKYTSVATVCLRP